MENASKALLIAAAVLVAIIIITFGIKIYTSTSETQKVATDTGDTISTKTGQATDSAISAITGTKASVINYGSKTRNTVELGDDISIGTENFRVVSNANGKIVAIPHYNITLTTDHPVQSASAGTIAFSSDNYWTKEYGWDNTNKVKDSSVNIDMTEKNLNGTYKNNIQQYIDAYKQTLENMGAGGIIVRACTYPKLKSELGDGLEIPLTYNQITKIRNPEKTGSFWLGSGTPRGLDYVYAIVSSGGAVCDCYYNSNGVRPVIEIP